MRLIDAGSLAALISVYAPISNMRVNGNLFVRKYGNSMDLQASSSTLKNNAVANLPAT